MAHDPGEVLQFWRDAGPDKWFEKDSDFDCAIEARFAALHSEAAGGGMGHWRGAPESALALLIVLDQFSRNMFRGSAKAFAQDALAREIALEVLREKIHHDIDPTLRNFVYLPLMHSESIVDQTMCVRLVHALSGAPGLSYAREHERIIRRFGRFPHRNAALGRHTSPAEQAFLDAGGFAG